MGSIIREISKYKNKMYKAVNKYGLNSKEVRKISDTLDKLINEYYSSKKQVEYPEFSDMYMYYQKSYKALKSITQQLERFPTIAEWNKFAKENNYLNHISLEYISKSTWRYLEIQVKRETNVPI